jgi:hypothetical protein
MKKFILQCVKNCAELSARLEGATWLHCIEKGNLGTCMRALDELVRLWGLRVRTTDPPGFSI